MIDALKDTYGVEPVCRTLGVPHSTYYARRTREPSARQRRDAELIAHIHAARAGYRRVYGQRKTWRELRRRGIDVGRDRVARLMRAHGLAGAQRGRGVITTRADRAADRARDLVRREFRADRPNQLWVADITYIRTPSGFCYLAFVLDVFSRRIVGWQIAAHMRTDLVMDALEMAVALRTPGAGLIAHSDRGSQYTSLAYTDRLDELGIAPSVGSRGDAYDNAMAESIVATYKTELIAGRRLPSLEAAEHETLAWIGFYNAERLHEELGDIPPDEFEAIHNNGHFVPDEADRPAVEGLPAGLAKARTAVLEPVN